MTASRWRRTAVSIAQAHFQGEAWFRAVYDDEQLVGFVMLYDPTLIEQPDEPDFFLWRLMIDKAHQGKGYGRGGGRGARRARAHAPGRAAAAGVARQGRGPAGRFYRSLGFAYTGAEADGELVMERTLG